MFGSYVNIAVSKNEMRGIHSKQDASVLRGRTFSM
jgi:hypothetical protein